jgi:hypothetical protein
MFFEPNLSILPAAQLDVWGRLQAVPPNFILYGGTAIALHLGHRQSEDFDFFSRQPFDPDVLLEAIQGLDPASVDQVAPNTLTIQAKAAQPVKMSFFGVPNLNLGPPLIVDHIGVRVATLIDLAATKTAVIPQRSEAKDYIDLAAILDDGRISLLAALNMAMTIYGSQFNPQLTLKALAYYGDGNLDQVPHETQLRLVKAATEVDPSTLAPTLRSGGQSLKPHGPAR